MQGPAAHSAMSAKIGCRRTESQPASGTEWAECQQPVSLPTGTWARVQAITAQCIAYDVLIEDRKAANASLPESVLVIATPWKLLEVAVEIGWLSASMRDESRRKPADPGRLPGKYRDEPVYRTWSWKLLAPRAEYWRARVNAEPFGFALAKPEFVLRPLPALAGLPGVSRCRICPHSALCRRGLRGGGVAAVPDGPTLFAPMPITPVVAQCSGQMGVGK
jgi:hypothetical protein